MSIFYINTRNLSVIFLIFALLLQISSFSSAERAGTIVPLYLWPEENSNGVHNWQPLIDAKKAYPQVDFHAIVNVNSGPGSSTSPEYTAAIKKLVDAGIKTLGYVRTDYAKREASAIKSEIDQWISRYPNSINGIFFDEMAYENKNTTTGRGRRRQTRSTADYYTDLTRYAKNKGMSFTVGNPGTDTTRDFVNSVDTIIIFETNTGFPGEDRIGTWHTEYPKEKWGIMPYKISGLNEGDVRNAKRFVKFIYVQSDDMPNPWDSLPQYLNDLCRVLNES